MQSVTLKVNAQKVHAELTSMAQWAERKLQHGNRQGALDVRYLKDRYSKGVSKVQKFCEGKHKQIAISDENFGSRQAEIVSFCNNAAASGGSASLI